MALTHSQYVSVGIWHNDCLCCVDDNTTQVSDHTHFVRVGRDMPFSKGSYFQSLSGIWGMGVVHYKGFYNAVINVVLWVHTILLNSDTSCPALDHQGALCIR